MEGDRAMARSELEWSDGGADARSAPFAAEDGLSEFNDYHQ
jgi:hypothetical protein